MNDKAKRERERGTESNLSPIATEAAGLDFPYFSINNTTLFIFSFFFACHTLFPSMLHTLFLWKVLNLGKGRKSGFILEHKLVVIQSILIGKECKKSMDFLSVSECKSFSYSAEMFLFYSSEQPTWLLSSSLFSVNTRPILINIAI